MPRNSRLSKGNSPIRLSLNSNNVGTCTTEELDSLSTFLGILELIQEPVYLRPSRDTAGWLVRCYQEGETVEVLAVSGNQFEESLHQIGEYIAGKEQYQRLLGRMNEARGLRETAAKRRKQEMPTQTTG